MLQREYAGVLDYIATNAVWGDIIALTSYIKNKINGNITKIVKDFIIDYENS